MHVHVDGITEPREGKQSLEEGFLTLQQNGVVLLQSSVLSGLDKGANVVRRNHASVISTLSLLNAAADDQAQNCDEEDSSENQSTHRHLSLGLLVVLRGLMVRNLDVGPSRSISVALEEILGEVLDLILSALRREAEAHAGGEPIGELAFTTSHERDVAVVVAVHSGEHVLRRGGVSQAGAVIGPLAKVPSVNQDVEDGTEVR
mmetsp:Transcript_22992/g.35520  ORF Transcript_22992/g.35520 Transcript_22992/m.35520 type:complete len:203 (-) Transcript_22992:209-817(-)